MRRAWLFITLLAGCDAVFGLDGRLPPGALAGDEDGDGTLDDEDPCPHIPNQSSIDEDNDGVPRDCDPDDSDGSTATRWFSLEAGSLDDAFVLSGMGTLTADGFDLGGHGVESSLLFEVTARTANIDIGFEILSNSVEDDHDHPWAELGVHTVVTRFTQETMRGSVCLFGVDDIHDDHDGPTAYLESKEGEQTPSRLTVASPLNGSKGRLYQFRTPERVRCGLLRNGTQLATTQYDVTHTFDTGAIGISADVVVARLTHIWIAWQTTL